MVVTGKGAQLRRWIGAPEQLVHPGDLNIEAVADAETLLALPADERVGGLIGPVVGRFGERNALVGARAVFNDDRFTQYIAQLVGKK